MKQFVYEKLASEIKQQITDGVWRADEKLPSIRALSKSHKVSIVSVQTALHKLEAVGLINAKPKSGYYVTANKVERVATKTVDRQPVLVKVPAVFHKIMEHGAAFDILPSAPANSVNNHIQLLNRHINRALRQSPVHNSLYYDNPAGDLALRSQISEHYRTRHLFVDPADICITSGCQNSLFIALSVCCQPGDTVVIESPAFYGCLQILEHLKLRVIEIKASTQAGIKSSELESILNKWQVKACIVSPNFATPTGSCLPSEEKKQLVSVAKAHNVTLIEDDIYGDLAFHLTSEPLKSFDNSGNVILCSSFSKSLSKDLRIGWVIGGKKHQELVKVKLINQLANNQAIQQGLASFIAEGFYRRHLLQYNAILERQRDSLINTIKKIWDFNFTFTVPNGGLSLWIALDSAVDTTKIYQQAIQDNIIITPGMLFSSNNDFTHCLRLSFVHEITAPRLIALKKIGSLIKGYL